MESFCLKWKQKTSPCTILPRSALILEFRNFFSHLILSLNLVPRILFKNCLFVTSLVEIWILLSILWCHFPPKTFKIEEQKEHKIVWNIKFYHPAKFELKRIKPATVVPRVQFQAFCWPSLKSIPLGLIVVDVVVKIFRSDTLTRNLRRS